MFNKISFKNLLVFSLIGLAGQVCYSQISYAHSAIDEYILSGHTIYGRLNTPEHGKGDNNFHVRLADSSGRTVTEENKGTISGAFNSLATTLHDEAFERQGFTPQFLSILQKAFVKGGRMFIRSKGGKMNIRVEYMGLDQNREPVPYTFDISAVDFRSAQEIFVARYNEFYAAQRSESAERTQAKLQKKAKVEAALGSDFDRRRKAEKDATITHIMSMYSLIAKRIRTPLLSVTVTPPRESVSQGPKDLVGTGVGSSTDGASSSSSLAAH